ncbi:hypothetical protein GEOBC_00551 [Geobacteraceae bacterium]|nr:hypothetical protein GEOBC_00551 [Geobacteraceae bacterium]
MRAIALTCALLASVPAYATLEGRDLDTSIPGHEAVYDTARNVTWLADPTASGRVTFADGQAFAENLTIGGFTGWRMADGRGEISNLYFDWMAAGYAQRGDEFPYNREGIDAGLDSRLFKVKPFGPSFWTFETQQVGDQVWHYDIVFFYEFIDSGTSSYCCHLGWAVHDGDIGIAVQVPEPATYVLTLVGLLAVVGWRSRRS